MAEPDLIMHDNLRAAHFLRVVATDFHGLVDDLDGSDPAYVQVLDAWAWEMGSNADELIERCIDGGDVFLWATDPLWVKLPGGLPGARAALEAHPGGRKFLRAMDLRPDPSQDGVPVGLNVASQYGTGVERAWRITQAILEADKEILVRNATPDGMPPDVLEVVRSHRPFVAEVLASVSDAYRLDEFLAECEPARAVIGDPHLDFVGVLSKTVGEERTERARLGELQPPSLAEGLAKIMLGPKHELE